MKKWEYICFYVIDVIVSSVDTLKRSGKFCCFLKNFFLFFCNCLAAGLKSTGCPEKNGRFELLKNIMALHFFAN